MALNQADVPTILKALRELNAAAEAIKTKAAELIVEADKIKAQANNILNDVRDYT